MEQEGIATTLTSWNAGMTRKTLPPRATFTRLTDGMTIGEPHDRAQQRRILEATLALLARDAPLDPVKLNEKWDKVGE
ncbi:MAG: hypothetical protein FJ317_04790 [SAR202 cluster bacterium]|nr:hypothetical protein [SAR202 cluster bacterium]